MSEEFDYEKELNSERRRVDVDTNNFPVRELVRMMVEGELNIAPVYQRKFRWSAETESALIESIFLGLPVPSLFVATNEGFEWEVVDGLQRLSTMLHFLDPSDDSLVRINRDKPLALSGLTKVPSLNGKTFLELPKPLQVHFGRQPIQVTALTDKSDKSIRFDLFERLNRGAVELSEQEVRACLYRGPFIELLDELGAMREYSELLILPPEKKLDGTAEEVVLKYFAYSKMRDSYDGKLKKLLNGFMERNFSTDDLQEMRNDFTSAVHELHAILGGQPYKRANYGLTPLVQFEASLIAVGDLLKEGKPIGRPQSSWVDDAELMESSMGGTNSKASLNKRINRARLLLGS